MATAIDYTKTQAPNSGLEGSQPASTPAAAQSPVSAYQYSPVTGTNSQGSDGLLDAPVAYGRADEARPSNDWNNVELAPTDYQYTGAQVESDGLLDNAVGDINRLTAENNPLMQQAGTRGLQAGNARGLANSSMSVTAGQQAALDVVMPLVDKRMTTDAQGLLNNQQGGITADLNEQQTQNTARTSNVQGNINAQLQDLNVENQAYLTAVDQSYNAFMEGNKNAMSFYQTSQEQIGAIMNNPDLTLEQRKEAIYEIQQALSAGLNFNGSLYSADFGGGTQQDTPSDSGQAPASGGSPASNYPGATTGGGTYPGSTGSQAVASSPENLFKNAYLGTNANGSVSVDMGQFNSVQKKSMFMLESIKNGLIKWDETKKGYVFAKDSPYGRMGNTAKDLVFGTEYSDDGLSSQDEGYQKSDAEILNRYSSGMSNIGDSDMRILQEINARGVYPNVRTAAGRVIK